MIDTKELLEHTDLVKLMEASLGEPGKRSGQWLFWSCPFHANDRTPSLGVKQGEDRWFCFGCGKGGDAIAWLQDYEGMTFKEACAGLGAGGAAGVGLRPAVSERIMRLQAADLQAADLQSAEQPETAPRRADQLQAAWRAVIERCQQMLWEPAGRRARDYLRQRGLKDATLQSPFARVGYSPGFEVEGVWVERGIVLPCFISTRELEIEAISYIKVRRPIVGPTGGAKYRKLSGGGAGLYGAEWAMGADVVFVTEGEFDALLLHQAAGDLVGVCTLGSATDRLNFNRFAKYLLAAKRIVIAYDNDSAGQQGAEAWKGLCKRTITARTPQGKDITDFWLGGGDLAGWVMAVSG